jgi:hypothetical protein
VCRCVCGGGGGLWQHPVTAAASKFVTCRRVVRCLHARMLQPSVHSWRWWLPLYLFTPRPNHGLQISKVRAKRETIKITPSASAAGDSQSEGPPGPDALSVAPMRLRAPGAGVGLSVDTAPPASGTAATTPVASPQVCT